MYIIVEYNYNIKLLNLPQLFTLSLKFQSILPTWKVIEKHQVKKYSLLGIEENWSRKKYRLENVTLCVSQHTNATTEKREYSVEGASLVHYLLKRKFHRLLPKTSKLQGKKIKKFGAKN